MKNLVSTLVILTLVTACDMSKSDKVLDFFDGLGVDVEVSSGEFCVYNQLDKIYEDSKDPVNTKNIIQNISTHNLDKIVIDANVELPVECDQAVLDPTTPVGEKVCDPGTYRGSEVKLAPTGLSFENGVLTITVNTQERLKNLILYEFKDIYANEYEKSVTRIGAEGEYISFDEVTSLVMDWDTQSIKRSTIPASYKCGELVSLKDILSFISL